MEIIQNRIETEFMSTLLKIASNARLKDRLI